MRTWIAAAFASGAPLSTVVYGPVTEWITGQVNAEFPVNFDTPLDARNNVAYYCAKC